MAEPLEGRQPPSDVPLVGHCFIADDNLRSAGESASPLCQLDVPTCSLGLEHESDRFPRVSGVFGSTPHDHGVTLVRNCCDSDTREPALLGRNYIDSEKRRQPGSARISAGMRGFRMCALSLGIS